VRSVQEATSRSTGPGFKTRNAAPDERPRHGFTTRARDQVNHPEHSSFPDARRRSVGKRSANPLSRILRLSQRESRPSAIIFLRIRAAGGRCAKACTACAHCRPGRARKRATVARKRENVKSFTKSRRAAGPADRRGDAIPRPVSGGSHLNRACFAGRGCPRPIAGRSLRASCPSLTRCRLRSRHPAFACRQRRLPGHGQPLPDPRLQGAARTRASSVIRVRRPRPAARGAAWPRGGCSPAAPRAVPGRRPRRSDRR